MLKVYINRWVSVIVLLFFVMPLAAQEHPKEHPTEKKTEHPTTQDAEHPADKDAEHPTEHPAEHPSKETSVIITKDNLADAIVQYVETESNQDMKFIVEDPETGESLELELVKVHKDRLSAVGDNLYFACADFKAQNGKIYDLDVFMNGKSAEELSFTKFLVHKEEGVERYGWQEENGEWIMIPLENKQKD